MSYKIVQNWRSYEARCYRANSLPLVSASGHPEKEDNKDDVKKGRSAAHKPGKLGSTCTANEYNHGGTRDLGVPPNLCVLIGFGCRERFRQATRPSAANAVCRKCVGGIELELRAEVLHLKATLTPHENPRTAMWTYWLTSSPKNENTSKQINFSPG